MDQKPKKLPSQKPASESPQIDPNPRRSTRKGLGLFGTAAMMAAVSAPPMPEMNRYAHRAFTARHVSRQTLAGEPHTSANKLRPATRKARRNHRRAMRNRMGYR